MVSSITLPGVQPLVVKAPKIVAGIPCFNTSASIARVVSGTRKFVNEVIVIDDGSTDSTVDRALNAGATVVRHGVNKGYGEAIKSCFTAAKQAGADILITIDGDGQHDPEEIPQLIAPIARGEAEVVIGSRFLRKEQAIPHYRRAGINIINWLWNIGARTKVSDSQSGSRAYGQSIIENLFFSEKGMGISIEILEKIRRLQAPIKEVPISCSYENNNCDPSLKAFLHGISVAFSVLKIRVHI
jgi:glycosyltransferase involved in cell wall biosynthesis